MSEQQPQLTQFQQKVQARMQEAAMQVELQESKQRFENQLANIHERAVMFCTKYGQEDWRTQLMVTFLDVLYLVQDSMEIIESMVDVVKCIGEVTNFMNDTINIFNQIMTSGIKQSPGLFGNLRAKIRAHRYSKAMTRSMKTMITYMGSMIGVSMNMGTSMQKMSIRMREQMAKQQTRAGKKGITPPGGFSGSRAMDSVLATATERNGGVAPSSGVVSAAGGSSTVGAGSGDISDII